MISNCKVCYYEFNEAYNYQKRGLFLATGIDDKLSENIGHKGHFSLIMVNNNGEIIIQ